MKIFTGDLISMPAGSNGIFSPEPFRVLLSDIISSLSVYVTQPRPTIECLKFQILFLHFV